MTIHTATVDLPAQTTVDQAIVALLQLRRGDVPGDATLGHAAVLQFGYARQAASSREDTATGSAEDSTFAFTSEDTDANGDGGEDEEITPDDKE